MNIKVSIVKLAIKLTPNKLIVWTANIILKDIAKLTEFNFDLEPRILHLKIHLNNNEWFIYKKDILIAKTKTLKSKIQFIILKYTENLENFNN